MLDVPSSTIFVCYMCLLILGILLYICLNLFLTYPMFSAFRLHFRVTSIAKSCNFEVSNFCCYQHSYQKADIFMMISGNYILVIVLFVGVLPYAMIWFLYHSVTFQDVCPYHLLLVYCHSYCWHSCYSMYICTLWCL